MANTIKLRRSATAGAVPTTAQLSLGELAINTTDGKMYLKKDVSGTETIVQIGGSIAIAGSPPADASAGDIYWDEDDGSAYIYYDDGNGAAQWVPLTETIIPGSEVRKLDDISSSFDGIETVFSLTLNTNAHTPAYQNGVFVSIGGVIQEPETDFTITGDQITFTTAPTSGLSFFAVDIGVVNPIGTPSDGTVTPAKLSAGGPSWDASSNLTIDGNVGVGTSSPAIPLDVYGADTNANGLGDVKGQLRVFNDTTAFGSSPRAGIVFSTKYRTSPDIPLDGAAIYGGKENATDANKDFFLAFATRDESPNEAVERMRIDSSGRVGIGSTTVADVLHIQTNATGRLLIGPNGASNFHNKIYNDNGDLMISCEGASSDMIVGSNRDIKFYTGGVSSSDEAARIDSSGRLLVGTSSNYGLTTNAVFAGDAAEGIVSIINDGDTFINTNDSLGTINFGGHESGGTAYVGASISADADSVWTGDSPGRLVFSTTADGDPSPTERMRIDSSGNVGIGTDNPTNALHVEGRNFCFGGPGNNFSGQGNLYIGNYNNPLLDSWERNLRIGSKSEIEIELYTDWDGTQYSDSILFSSPEGLGLQFNGNKGGVNRSSIFPLNYHAGTAITDDYLFFQAGNKYLWFDADTGRLGINRPSGSGWTDTLDVNGTARVTGIATFDSNVTITGSVTSEGSAVATVGNNQTFTKAQRGGVVTLTDGATITPDFAAGNNFAVTIAGNRTLNNPSNITPGQSGVIVITHSGTNRTLSYGSYYKFSNGITPSLSATSGAVDVLSYYVATTSFIVLTLLKGLS